MYISRELNSMPSRHKLGRKRARAIAWQKELVAKRKRRKAKAKRMTALEAENKEA